MIKEAKQFIEALVKTKMDPEGQKTVRQTVADSDIQVYGRSVPFSYIPMFFNEADQEFFAGILETTQTILSKMTRQYLEDPSYRKIFGFSPEMEKLICLPCHYPEIIPVGRYDLFMTPSDRQDPDFWFCEFNTDGTGGMSRDGFIANEIIKGQTMTLCQKDFSAEPFSTIETITDQLIEIYFSDSHAVEHPTICITDFREEGVMSDFERFAACFRNRGIPSRFVDVRDLVFDGEHLYDKNDGLVIHGLYRRLVTSVLLERMDECRALIDAVAAEKVVLLGHFRTSLAHSKVVNIAMFHPSTKAILTESENAFIAAHIPATYRLNTGEVPPEILKEAENNPKDWIIKPDEGFGAHGVYAGMDQDRDLWQKLLRENHDRHYILQRFIVPGKMMLLGPEEREPALWPVMIGLYQAGGKPAGFYNRAGREGVIDFEHGGILVPSVKVKSYSRKDRGMSKIYTSAEQLIGRTPLLELCGIEKALGLKAKVLAKLEMFNPAGSAKDRIAKKMIDEAEASGLLKPGAVIIEPTSGNTGIGLASVGAARGYRVIIVMPDSMSVERRLLMQAFGAELVLTDGAKGMKGCIEKAEALAAEIPGSFIPGQFDNPANAQAHYETTGPEIEADTNGQVDIFVAGVGTGGTITGTGTYLKEKNPAVKIVAVEPADSPLLSGGKAGSHPLQGIGANFVPKVLDTAIYDEIIPVTGEDAFETGKMIGRKEGILVGISSGAAAFAAIELAKRPENEGKNIVVLLPDTGDRYLSGSMFAD